MSFAPLCPHCGAPAPSVEALRTGYRCTYCERVVDATTAPAPAPTPLYVPEPQRAPPVPVQMPHVGNARARNAPSGPRRSILPYVFLVGLVLFILVSPKTCGTFLLSGETSSALDAVRKCPRATELLGNDVAPAWIGCATGQSKSGCDSGSGHWRMPVTGSRANGTLQISASKHKSGWKASAVYLEVGDTRIDVMACTDLPEESGRLSTLSVASPSSSSEAVESL